TTMLGRQGISRAPKEPLAAEATQVESWRGLPAVTCSRTAERLRPTPLQWIRIRPQTKRTQAVGRSMVLPTAPTQASTSALKTTGAATRYRRARVRPLAPNAELARAAML